MSSPSAEQQAEDHRKPRHKFQRRNLTGRIGTVGGWIFFGLGIAALVLKGLTDAVIVDVGLLNALGWLILVFAVSAWVKRLTVPFRAATLPEVAGRETVSIPGDDFDAQLRSQADGSVDRLSARNQLYRRLKTTAQGVLDRHTDGETPADDLEAGTWTDDEVAAGVFADEGEYHNELERVSSRSFGDIRFADGVASVVRELLAVSGEQGDASLSMEGDDAGRDTESYSLTGEQATNRWSGAGALALTFLGCGLVTATPELVLGSGVLAGVGTYALAGTSPGDAVTVTRSIEPSVPRPGESVTVTVSITNTGDRYLPDLRILDGVPGDLTVASASPRYGTALKPGATATYSYELAGVRGVHEFEDARLVSGNFARSLERITTVEVDGDGAVTYDITSALELSVPLHRLASNNVGRLTTDVGGSGLELHSVREYRAGDPLSRIDWNRLAGGRDLATMQFREERSATVVLAIDARAVAYVGPEDGPSALDRSVLAAAKLAAALVHSDDRVGLTALSPRACWVPVGGGTGHLTRLQGCLASHEAFAPDPPDTDYHVYSHVARLRKRLPNDAQLIVCSPANDDGLLDMVRRLQVSGYPVTLLSPDVTAGGTVGQSLARIERSLRLSTLRRAGARVIDWERDQPLELAITNARRRWD